MIRTCLTLNTNPATIEDLIAYFDQQQTLDTSIAQPDCDSVELTVSEDRTQAIVTAILADIAAYTRWTDRSGRDGPTVALNRHLTTQISAATVARRFDIAPARTTRAPSR